MHVMIYQSNTSGILKFVKHMKIQCIEIYTCKHVVSVSFPFRSTFSHAHLLDVCHARIQMGPDPPPPENHRNIWFPSNTGSDPLKNHKATKPAFNERP